MSKERTPPIYDDSHRAGRDLAFLWELGNVTRTILIRLQRNGLRGDALADAVAETVDICWLAYTTSKRTIHSAVGFAVAETRTRLRAIREAQRLLACEWWPNTMTDRIVWEYPDGEIAVEEADFPHVPVETRDTRKRAFVKVTDFDRPDMFPLLASREMGDMEAAEEIEAEDARQKLAGDVAWIGCRESNLLAAIERTLLADAE
jgi:hypothetical protein